MRLDLYLKQKFPHLSRSRIIKDIKNGLVLVNGKKTKPAYFVRPNDDIRYKPSERPILKSAPRFDINISPFILYEDQNILVLNKPAGLAVHRRSLEANENSLIDALVQLRPSLKKVGEDPLRPGVVHRLDKDTSGVLVVAKDNKTFYELKQQFQNRLVKKVYIALVWGDLKESKGEINLPIGRSVKQPTKQAVSKPTIKSKKLRPALTAYKVIKRYQGFTLLEVYPYTGRTHQIRVHLAAIGHPVVGDKKYGFKKTKAVIPLTRQFLHAYSLSFSLGRKNFTFEAEIPEELKKFLSQLEK